MKQPFPKPNIVPHAEWESSPPVGFPARGKRRNIAVSGTIEFEALTLELVEIIPALPEDAGVKDKVVVKLSKGSKSEEKTIEEGTAFNWDEYHISVLAIHARKEDPGFGLTEFEICAIDSLPPAIAASTKADDATHRARFYHTIDMITLHHSGDPEPVTAEDDPVKKLQKLLEWGKREKNWWDVPYHFLIFVDGTIYEGRDYAYIGETNTTYNPTGHLLINVMGNYELQEASEIQLKAITDLMAWAVQEFDVSLNKIKGHCDYAETACPGKNLKSHLKNGTFVHGIKQRLETKRHTNGD